MKTLSVLLLLALGVGAAWWKVTYPDGTIDDARAQADAIANRLKVGLVAVRDGAVAAADGPSVVAQADTAMNSPTATGADADSARIDEMHTRLDAIETTLAQASATSVAADADTESAEIEGTETEGTDTLDPELLDRLARLEANIAEVDERANVVVTTVATVDERNQELAAQLESMAENPPARANDNTGTDTQAGSSDDGLAERTDSSDDSGLAAMAIGTSLEESVFDERIAKLVDSRLETALAELPAETETDSDDESATATLAPDAEERLAALESQIATLAEAAPASFDAVQAELRQEIAALAERLSAMPVTTSADSASESTQLALEQQMNTLEDRLESLPVEPDESLVSTLAEVRQQVDALSQKGFVTQEELRAQMGGKSIEYKIYFDRNSIEIGTDAARVLDSFIAQEKNRTTGVSIYGFTDRQGDAAYNQRLALERATAVRSYLIQNGLDYTKIRAMSGFGEDAAAAVQPDEADDAQQRVVVLFAAQP